MGTSDTFFDGFIYLAVAFSFMVELLNIKVHRGGQSNQ